MKLLGPEDDEEIDELMAAAAAGTSAARANTELEVEEWEEAMADDLEARSRWWPARDKFGDG